ncbi:MAG: hypothetical protein HYY96_12115 [Candidatus Tectomicrobia bacterium]|nr:hypothetical protein [Candidatus Tectomicrobia bacterium]
MVRPFHNDHANASPYWNPGMETMPRAQLDALHLRRIQLMIRFAYENSPFYRKLYREAGFTPDDIRSLDDFIRLVPVIDKKDLVQAQGAGAPPYGDARALPEEYNLYRFQTSGSTGTPLQIPFGYYSSAQYGEQWVYGFWAVGLRAYHTFYFAFNWGTFAGFWSAYWGVRRLGATVISGGGLDTKGRINHILQSKPDVLVATPTYALYMAEVAKGMGVDLRETTIKYFYSAGEPGPSIPTTRRAIEEAWGAKAFELYGIAEVGAIAPGCPLQGGVHLAEDWAHSLVLGEDGKPVAAGEVGENVVTSYVQHVQPIIKYRSHDLVRPRYGICDCGRTWTYYDGGVLGRTDHMIIIKGTNVYPTAVEALLGDVAGLSEHYEIHVDTEDKSDSITVKVEAARGLPSEQYEKAAQEAARLLYKSIMVRIGIKVLPPESLPRYELKAKRFFDHRPAGKGWVMREGTASAPR